MKTLTLKNIAKSYTSKHLFADVSFSVGLRDRVAVIGGNGLGKSTLVKIAAGIESYDHGTVICDDSRVTYVPQDFSGETSVTIMEYLDHVKASSKVFDLIKQFRIISETEIESGFVYQLSGGQRRVLQIASVLSRSPMFLCLDEPENHLDIHSRSVLTELLKDYWGGVLFVTHDRSLINSVSNKIVCLENETTHLVSGKSYEEYLSDKKTNMEHEIARWKSENRLLKKAEDNVRLLKARTRYGDTQAKTYQMKKRELERRKEELGPCPLPEPKTPKIDAVDTRSKNGKLMVQTDELSFGYDERKLLFSDVSLDLRFGQKVVLLGRNGCGKSSFLNLLQQKVKPTSGSIKIGNDIVIEYVDQNNSIDSGLSPIEHYRLLGIEEEQARSLLSGLGFSTEESSFQFANLSGGQQLRLRFSLLFMAKPELIILDEPTNNLDPTMWNLLLDLLNNYTGTVLVVSHDQKFVEGIADKRLWVVSDGSIKESWSEVEDVVAGM